MRQANAGCEIGTLEHWLIAFGIIAQIFLARRARFDGWQKF
jgi:hypothetical protein